MPIQIMQEVLDSPLIQKIIFNQLKKKFDLPHEHFIGSSLGRNADFMNMIINLRKVRTKGEINEEDKVIRQSVLLSLGNLYDITDFHWADMINEYVSLYYIDNHGTSIANKLASNSHYDFSLTVDMLEALYSISSEDISVINVVKKAAENNPYIYFFIRELKFAHPNWQQLRETAEAMFGKQRKLQKEKECEKEPSRSSPSILPISPSLDPSKFLLGSSNDKDTLIAELLRLGIRSPHFEQYGGSLYLKTTGTELSVLSDQPLSNNDGIYVQALIYKSTVIATTKQKKSQVSMGYNVTIVNHDSLSALRPTVTGIEPHSIQELPSKPLAEQHVKAVEQNEQSESVLKIGDNPSCFFKLRGLSGKEISVNTTPEKTISDIKEAFSTKIGIPTSRFNLIFNSKMLSSLEHVSKIPNGGTVYITPTLGGTVRTV